MITSRQAQVSGVLRRDRLGGLIREYAQVAQGETIPGDVRLAL